MLVTSLAARAEDEGAFLAVQYGFVAIAQKYAASDEDLERKKRQLDMLKE
jgi:hypothetical protein